MSYVVRQECGVCPMLCVAREHEAITEVLCEYSARQAKDLPKVNASVLQRLEHLFHGSNFRFERR